MTNIPKKLEDTKWQDTFFAIEDLVNKINEIIDHLQAKEEEHSFNLDIAEERGYWQGRKDEKEESSKYKVAGGNSGSIEEASKGECKECGAKYPAHNGDCSELYPHPPEHEEEFGGVRRRIDSGEYSTLEIMSYIRDNFVSKEKIKREMGEYFYDYIADKLGLRD